VRRASSVLLATAGLALLGWFAARFPWAAALRSVEGASLPLLGAVAVANLLSLVAKGAGWQILLQRHARPQMADSVSATIIGAAVGSLGPSVAGEAARLRFIVGRGGVTLGGGLSTIVGARILEAVALLAVLSVAGMALPPSPYTASLRLAAPVLLALTAVVSQPRILRSMAHRLPPAAGSVLQRWATTLGGRGTAGAVLLSGCNWFLQWAAYTGAGLAVSLPHARAIGFAALLLCNVGGAARLTPGNIGVLQASFALAAAPFGAGAAPALAASLVLQAAQVLPVIAAGLAILASTGRERAETVA
jgi:uncharacterized membrane protein YbhN (UPF0104 family)